MKVNLGNVSSECSDDDHGNDPGEEEDNNNAVDDGEPMYLGIRHFKVNVPPRSPLYVRFLPGHLKYNSFQNLEMQD